MSSITVHMHQQQWAKCRFSMITRQTEHQLHIAGNFHWVMVDQKRCTALGKNTTSKSCTITCSVSLSSVTQRLKTKAQYLHLVAIGAFDAKPKAEMLQKKKKKIMVHRSHRSHLYHMEGLMPNRMYDGT